MLAPASLDNCIQSEAGFRGGKPRIAGTRNAISDVVLCHLRTGMPLEQIAGDYNLMLSSAHAAMAYYHDNTDAIDMRMAEEFAIAAQLENQSVPPGQINNQESKGV